MLLVKVFFFLYHFYEKCFYKLLKSDSNSIFDNMLYKYKNTFNISKLLKKYVLQKENTIIKKGSFTKNK